jgi:hypothetical protein
MKHIRTYEDDQWDNEDDFDTSIVHPITENTLLCSSSKESDIIVI